MQKPETPELSGESPSQTEFVMHFIPDRSGPNKNMDIFPNQSGGTSSKESIKWRVIIDKNKIIV